jgi:hypothetical protein
MKRCLVLILCVAALTFTANATDIYNNLASPSDGADSITGFGPLYDSFLTGGSTFDLASVGLKLFFPGPATGTFTVGLYADNSISPGALLYTIATVSDSSLTVGLNDYNYNLAAPQLLAANTRYWIGLSSSDSNTFWSWSLDQSGIGVVGNYFANQNGVFSNDNGPYQMRVSDTTTPEPGSLVLLGTGLAGMTGLLRRKIS